jgi:hypothetical protein
MPLLGRELPPPHCLLLIFPEAQTLSVERTEVAVRPGVALLGGAPEPLRSLVVVLANALTIRQQPAYFVLRLCNATLSGD